MRFCCFQIEETTFLSSFDVPVLCIYKNINTNNHYGNIYSNLFIKTKIYLSWKYFEILSLFFKTSCSPTSLKELISTSCCSLLSNPLLTRKLTSDTCFFPIPITESRVFLECCRVDSVVWKLEIIIEKKLVSWFLKERIKIRIGLFISSYYQFWRIDSKRQCLEATKSTLSFASFSPCVENSCQFLFAYDVILSNDDTFPSIIFLLPVTVSLIVVSRVSSCTHHQFIFQFTEKKQIKKGKSN